MWPRPTPTAQPLKALCLGADWAKCATWSCAIFGCSAKVVVKKVLGTQNSADAVTNFLGVPLLQDRLRRLSLRLEWVYNQNN